MEFRILGPLEVSSGAVRLEVGGVRNQKVLAALLLSAGRVATLTHLVDVVWGDRPPSTSRHQIHKSIAELRMALYRDGDLIQTDSAGYRLTGGEVDLRSFENLVAEAQDRPAEQAVAKLRLALGLWRGRALAGLESAALRADVDRLEERRVEVLELCIGLELALGRHRELIPELTALVAANPFRERFAELLMTTLYRSGRQADALAVYQETRRRLADDLGVEPGASLRAAHQAVLSQEPVAAAPASATAGPPAQLPPDLRRFTGRQEHLALLDDVLADGSGTVVITAIAGVAGVGKTALAVHWSHRVRDRFPDGQLYINLRGYDDAPATTPVEALGQFLRGLGIEAARIPAGLDERAALFRSLVAGRRLLLVLDNAGSEEQIRPLLPGAAECTVLITSRSDLRGLAALDDVLVMELDVLAPEEAHQLITNAVGAERAAAEPAAVAGLAGLCGRLPLAMRIAAANLASRPNQPVADAVAELSGDDRLARLTIRGDRRAAVSAAFELSYRALPEDARTMFRRLGLLPRTDFALDAANALFGAPACGPLAVLEKAHLVEPHTSGRFRLHDLIRLYAQELLRADPDAEAARIRLLDFYLYTTDAALDVVAPAMFRLERHPAVAPRRFTSRADALSWLDAERESIVTCVRQCAQEGPRGHAWQLADALRRYFWASRAFGDGVISGTAALRAAEADNDPRGLIAAHSVLGTMRLNQDPRLALEHWGAVLAHSRAIGHRPAEDTAVHNLASVYLNLGQPGVAIDHLEQLLARDVDLVDSGLTLINLGSAAMMAGQLTAGREYYDAAVARIERRDRSRLVPALAGRADIALMAGDVDLTRALLDRAAAVSEEAGLRTWQCVAGRIEVMLARDTGRAEEALHQAERLLALSERTGSNHDSIVALNLLPALQHHMGLVDEAMESLYRGLQLARSQDKAYQWAVQLIELARVLGALGNVETAAPHAREALELARRNGLRILEGRALTTLTHLDPAATDHAEEALKIQRQTGYLLGQAEALAVLGRTAEAKQIFTRFTGGDAPPGTLGGPRTV